MPYSKWKNLEIKGKVSVLLLIKRRAFSFFLEGGGGETPETLGLLKDTMENYHFEKEYPQFRHMISIVKRPELFQTLEEKYKSLKLYFLLYFKAHICKYIYDVCRQKYNFPVHIEHQMKKIH